MKKIYMAGGCFWGAEKAFQKLDGVIETTVGYANGHVENPTYKLVCTGTTGYRETVEVVYDPETVSLNTLLEAFFLFVDPTVKNQQGHDIGSQYQSGVYYVDEEDRPVIEEFFNNVKGNYSAFCIELEPLKVFYPAEDYHQDYLIKNPQGYCHISLEAYREIEKLNRVNK